MQELNTKRFGSVLKLARVTKQLRQDELGGIVGVSPKAISSYENGRAMPTMRTFFAIYKTLNIPPHTFFEE